MVRRWVCGVVVVAMVFSSLGWSAPAMAKQPSDYFVTEVVGGAIGMGLGAGLGWSLGKLGVLFFPRADWEGASGNIATIGVALTGTSLGVILAGDSYGVQGNIPLTFVGTVLGGALGLGLGLSIAIGSYDVNGGTGLSSLGGGIALGVLFLGPILGATIGFNIGATMKDTGQPASLPWTLDLPVLSLEF